MTIRTTNNNTDDSILQQFYTENPTLQAVQTLLRIISERASQKMQPRHLILLTPAVWLEFFKDSNFDIGDIKYLNRDDHFAEHAPYVEFKITFPALFQSDFLVRLIRTMNRCQDDMTHTVRAGMFHLYLFRACDMFIPTMAMLMSDVINSPSTHQQDLIRLNLLLARLFQCNNVSASVFLRLSDTYETRTMRDEPCQIVDDMIRLVSIAESDDFVDLSHLPHWLIWQIEYWHELIVIGSKTVFKDNTWPEWLVSNIEASGKVFTVSV